MGDPESQEQLLERADALIAECVLLSQLLRAWKTKNEKNGEVEGLMKLTSMLNAENKFLDKVRNTVPDAIKPSQINSSNVPYLSSLIRALVISENVVAVRKAFLFGLDDYTKIEPTEKNFRIESNGTPGFSKGGGGKKKQQQQQQQQKQEQQRQRQQQQHLHRQQKNQHQHQHQQPQKQRPPTLAVKVDLVTDHGTTWHKINAASAWGLIHEFAGMEDDSDDESDIDSDEEDDSHDLETGQRVRPVHVSKETHPDLTLMTRALALASSQNRIHYHHRPQIKMHFTGFQPAENPKLNEMILNAVRVGSLSQSNIDGTIDQCLIPIELGPIQMIEGLVEEAVALAGLAPNETVEDIAAKDGQGADGGLVDVAKDLNGIAISDPNITGSQATTSTPTTLIPSGNTQHINDMHLFTEILNIDITTMMALSSSLCHTINPDPRLLTSPPLILQAHQEAEEPLLPIFAKLFKGRKRLVMTRAAMERFRIILNLIGGEEEKWRGNIMIHDDHGRFSDDDGSSDDDKDDDDSDRDDCQSFGRNDTNGRVNVGKETWEEIKERWIRGSQWARERGVFADGPPLIFVIEDYEDPYPPGVLAADTSTEAVDSQPQPRQQQLPQDSEKHAENDDGSNEGVSEGTETKGMMAHANSSNNSLSSNMSEKARATFTRTHPLDRQKRGSSNTELMSHLHTSIFLAGYYFQMTTLSANGFGYRATTRAGRVPEDISVWFHAPRSLAEAKMGKQKADKQGQGSNEGEEKGQEESPEISSIGTTVHV